MEKLVSMMDSESQALQAMRDAVYELKLRFFATSSDDTVRADAKAMLESYAMAAAKHMLLSRQLQALAGDQTANPSPRGTEQEVEAYFFWAGKSALVWRAEAMAMADSLEEMTEYVPPVRSTNDSPLLNPTAVGHADSLVGRDYEFLPSLEYAFFMDETTGRELVLCLSDDKPTWEVVHEYEDESGRCHEDYIAHGTVANLGRDTLDYLESPGFISNPAGSVALGVVVLRTTHSTV